ncbi:peptidyl-prolyl cis-trans isomerase 6-like [Portunus trituberculatus]|uniref:peptidyl-prolyl cis-trans isomerase 6-like n=1 Tax=Portunus trituberculatus TaxID=210409 RepID=UPI001E1CD5CB|nr:peptidyl-prolyl cis-trans isomerase 6-like [Portunus trituberculatus]
MRFRFPEITITRLFIWIVTVPTIYVFLMVAYMHSDSRDFKVTQEVYFLVERDGKPLGEMVFGLFGEAAPRTVRNFVTFATKGYKGKKYQGSKFHRVVKKFMIQGGDVVSGDGKGSLSIYGETFADEKMEINHSTQGMLSMANKGPNTNGCQFFITTIATPWLDGHHVVFGKLVKGEEVMREIENTATDWQDRPLKDIVISKSGRRPFVEAYYISNNPYNLRDWMKTMTLPIGSVVVLIIVYHKCIKIFDAASGDDDDKTKKAKKETEKAKKTAEKKRKSRKEEGNETEEETMAIETEGEEEQEEEEKVGEETEGLPKSLRLFWMKAITAAVAAASVWD